MFFGWETIFFGVPPYYTIFFGFRGASSVMHIANSDFFAAKVAKIAKMENPLCSLSSCDKKHLLLPSKFLCVFAVAGELII